ncbi:uncharacterized serine-rich protein C215.13 [Drosophila grimshawi]|uniref:GH16397 n=1 Tax=Drosophila grimshawi TaxID=7222 RepID=B4IZD2_DROGR|nr:uncharacterized serine-rich protein C215.13 [Drosophila grimshawi]EDV96687.1 GH16397 [Drosophila grimshawi]
MKCALIFTLLAVAASTSLAAPLDLNDLFLGLPRNAPAIAAPQPDQDVVKRQVLANPDNQLKQVSFQALIGNLENSLFESALSLNGASAPDSVVTEVKPEPAKNSEHIIAKRSGEPVASTTPVALSDEPEERKILVLTTKKVPLSEEGGPAHLIIDHVSVQPHNGASVPVIPIFQVHHTKITSATIKEDASKDSSDGKQTKISITKTSITSTAPVESLETQSSITSSSTSSTELPHSGESSSSTTIKSTTTNSSPISTTNISATSTIPSTTASTTTSSGSIISTTSEQPIIKLKQEEEQKLKAKVAEVEAEPIILSARV